MLSTEILLFHQELAGGVAAPAKSNKEPLELRDCQVTI